MSTTRTDQHWHMTFVDSKGNGSTTSTSLDPAHRHKIVGWKVQPGGDDQHTHEYVQEFEEDNPEDRD